MSDQIFGEGFAVVRNGKIDVATVAATVRAAKVNWLVVNAMVMITNSHSDSQIEKIWRQHSDAEVVAVTIYTT